jgi:DAACS family dicarboxylate/amino acid:cation (Na+ or H+) symporter
MNDRKRSAGGNFGHLFQKKHKRIRQFQGRLHSPDVPGCALSVKIDPFAPTGTVAAGRQRRFPPAARGARSDSRCKPRLSSSAYSAALKGAPALGSWIDALRMRLSQNMDPSSNTPQTSLLSRWHHTPLYIRILGALVLGVVTGLVAGPKAAIFSIPSKIVLQLLGTLAPPLILTAVIQALMKAHLEKGTGGRLLRLLLLNTMVAISIGLLVANVLQPGHWSTTAVPTASATVHATPPGMLLQFLENIPKSFLGPLTDNGKVLSVILLAVAVGMALRRVGDRPITRLSDLVNATFDTLITLLHWVVDLIPFAVFGIVASLIGTKGVAAFQPLGAFILAVLLGLLLQSIFYLVRIRLLSWVRPMDLLRGTRDALVMAFSTGSSTATMPVTYECLRQKVGLRDRSASLGALVGSNFNNDGTALYEAMSALFVSQILVQQGLGTALTLPQQLLVVVTSVIASVGAAGIPEAGLVTMTLVFNAVGLPPEYIAVLLPVDWFLDRCRTVINVLGDMNVACLFDGQDRDRPLHNPFGPLDH